MILKFNGLILCKIEALFLSSLTESSTLFLAYLEPVLRRKNKKSNGDIAATNDHVKYAMRQSNTLLR